MLWKLVGVTVGVAATLSSFVPLREGLSALAHAAERSLQSLFGATNPLAAQTLGQLAPSVAAVAVAVAAVAGLKARRLSAGVLLLLVSVLVAQQGAPLLFALALAAMAAAAMSTLTGAALVLPLSAASVALALEGARQSLGMARMTFEQLREIPSSSAADAALLASTFTWESFGAVGSVMLALVALRVLLVPR
jgi:hypothetical protein